VRIILDTGVFFRPEALRRLSGMPHLVVVPAVAFAERARQLAKRGVGPDAFLDVLDRLGFHVEPFGPEEALRFAPGLADDGRWRALARDAMIAGHLRPADLLWTTDPKDFLELGVPKDRLVGVP
jgi:hypothetical protein